MNFPDWPQDSLPGGGETAGSRIKIEQDGMIEKRKEQNKKEAGEGIELAVPESRMTCEDEETED